MPRPCRRTAENCLIRHARATGKRHAVLQNVVKVISYIVGEESILAYIEAHRKIAGPHMSPWILLVASALGKPHYKADDVTAAG